jgi:hypothetical protein
LLNVELGKRKVVKLKVKVNLMPQLPFEYSIKITKYLNRFL